MSEMLITCTNNSLVSKIIYDQSPLHYEDLYDRKTLNAQRRTVSQYGYRHHKHTRTTTLTVSTHLTLARSSENWTSTVR